jgi:hypothetical protein
VGGREGGREGEREIEAIIKSALNHFSFFLFFNGTFRISLA